MTGRQKRRGTSAAQGRRTRVGRPGDRRACPAHRDPSGLRQHVVDEPVGVGVVLRGRLTCRGPGPDPGQPVDDVAPNRGPRGSRRRTAPRALRTGWRTRAVAATAGSSTSRVRRPRRTRRPLRSGRGRSPAGTAPTPPRPSSHRRRHRGVDGEQSPGRMRDLGDAGDVADVPQRVAGRFDVDELGGSGLHSSAHGGEIGRVDKVDLMTEPRAFPSPANRGRPNTSPAKRRCARDPAARARWRWPPPHRSRTAALRARLPVPRSPLRLAALWHCRRGHRRSRSDIDCRHRARTWSPRGPAAPPPW